MLGHPTDCSLTRLLCPQDFPGKNTGVDSINGPGYLSPLSIVYTQVLVHCLLLFSGVLPKTSETFVHNYIPNAWKVTSQSLLNEWIITD